MNEVLQEISVAGLLGADSLGLLRFSLLFSYLRFSPSSALSTLARSSQRLPQTKGCSQRPHEWKVCTHTVIV